MIQCFDLTLNTEYVKHKARGRFTAEPKSSLRTIVRYAQFIKQ